MENFSGQQIDNVDAAKGPLPKGFIYGNPFIEVTRHGIIRIHKKSKCEIDCSILYLHIYDINNII